MSKYYVPLPEYASCCVLSYNRGTFLYRSVKSLLENADYPLELIIHDDGSTDAMVEDTLRWAREEGAMVIRNPPGWNEGQGVALNRMFRMATGWPRFKLDQDLEYKPGWLRSAVDLMHCTPEIGLLGLFKYNHDPVDHTKTILEDWGDHEEHTHICGSGFGLSEEAWLEQGPFEERSPAFAEDWEMQKRVTESPYRYCALPKEDLVDNFGFGIGPSTVVVAENKVQEIRDRPKIILQRLDK